MATTNYIISMRANIPTDVEAWSSDSDGGKLVIIDDTQSYRKRNTLRNVIRLDKIQEELENEATKLCGVNVMPVPSKISGNDFTAVTLVNRGVVDIDFSKIPTPTDGSSFFPFYDFQIWPLRKLNTVGNKWRCFVDFKGHEVRQDVEHLFGTSVETGMTGLESSENHLVKLVNVDALEAKQMPTLVSNKRETLLSIWPNAKGEGKVPAISQGTFTVFFEDNGRYNEYDDLLRIYFTTKNTTGLVCLEKFDSSARFKIVSANAYLSPYSIEGLDIDTEEPETQQGYNDTIFELYQHIGYRRLYDMKIDEIVSKLNEFKESYAKKKYSISDDDDESILEGGDY